MLLSDECVQEPWTPEIGHRGRRIEQHKEATDNISESVGVGRGIVEDNCICDQGLRYKQ